MASYTMNISPVAGTSTATSDQAGKALFLGNSDALVAKIGNAFIAPAKITTINFFVSSETKANATAFLQLAAVNAIGATHVTYPSPAPKPPAPSVSLAFVQVASDFQSITVADDEGTPANDEHFWYTIQVTDGNGKVWTLDPEVINTGGNDPRRGFSVPTDADKTRTLNASGAMALAGAVVTRNPFPATQPTST